MNLSTSPVAAPGQIKRKSSTSSASSKAKASSPSLKRAGSSAGKRVVKRNASTPPVRGLSRDPSVGPSEADNDETISERGSSQAPPNEEEKEKVAEEDAGEESEEETKDLGVDDFDMRMMIQSELDRRKQDMRLLMESFSDEQMARFEAWSRSGFNKNNVRKLVSQVLNQPCSPTMALAVAGFAKVFVGEIIEKAREVMSDLNEEGPMRPDHIREAYRQYKKETGLIPENNYQRRLLR
ncbi:hypothetical protein K450DRAFT_233697 [Umbelopsis ramanniana AG]|uniref:Transcription initiation factor TFIID subunit 11 n=1 Tax=Umbelopsis ramanniana AG TaxID=1314678 RepID=A0AAD5HED6_UMBRA|nr:uncharacterized protein K450DRAFT_233697 [Umbelopsis ramanniana AG]KAI8581222.1 hypothetical protein K450DRAFT_233697 [Umbelopsis ramanniana AG]